MKFISALMFGMLATTSVSADGNFFHSLAPQQSGEVKVSLPAGKSVVNVATFPIAAKRSCHYYTSNGLHFKEEHVFHCQAEIPALVHSDNTLTVKVINESDENMIFSIGVMPVK